MIKKISNDFPTIMQMQFAYEHKELNRKLQNAIQIHFLELLPECSKYFVDLKLLIQQFLLCVFMLNVFI